MKSSEVSRLKKKVSRKKVVNIAAISMLAAALVLGLLLFLLQVEEVRQWYEGMQMALVRLENRIASIENRGTVMAVILLIFALKSVVPFPPISTVCFITGMVFPGFTAFAINMLGIAVQMSISYARGRFFGGGNVHKFLNKYQGTRQVLESKKSYHPLLLLGFRVVPFVPMNTVSRVFGSTGMKFFEYLFVSLGGFAPKVVSYTIIGRNVYDPLSPSFIVPIIALLVISGLSALILNFILSHAAGRDKQTNLKDNNNGGI